MSYLEAHAALSARDDLSGVEIALATLIKSLQEEIATLRARIEALEAQIDAEEAA